MSVEGKGIRVRRARAHLDARPLYRPAVLPATMVIAGAVTTAGYTWLLDHVAQALANFCLFRDCSSESPVGAMVVITVIGFVLFVLHLAVAAGLFLGRPAARRAGIALGVLWILACVLPIAATRLRDATALLIPGALAGLAIFFACLAPFRERTGVR